MRYSLCEKLLPANLLTLTGFPCGTVTGFPSMSSVVSLVTSAKDKVMQALTSALERRLLLNVQVLYIHAQVLHMYMYTELRK